MQKPQEEQITNSGLMLLGFKKYEPYKPSYHGKKSGGLHIPDGLSQDDVHEASLWLGCSAREAIERMSV